MGMGFAFTGLLPIDIANIRKRIVKIGSNVLILHHAQHLWLYMHKIYYT